MRNILALILGSFLLLFSCEAGGSPTAPTSVFPLKISANGRTLVDQEDNPFLLIGDAPQALTVNVSSADADYFLADRASRGFNAVWIMLLCNEYSGGRADASTYDGIKPFILSGNLATPNEDYFARCDQVIRAAAEHGLLVILDPIDTGGFLGMMRTNGVDKCKVYGRYLGSRYRTFDNIVWMSGSDFQTWSDPYDYSVVKAVAAGIRETDTRHIQTLQLNYYVSSSLDDSRWSDLVTLNAAYTYYPTYAEVLEDYGRTPAVPVFLIEADYELSRDADAERLRRQAYWSLLAGACGHVYGHNRTWSLQDGWKSYLGSVGTVQFGYCRDLLESRPWYSLVPDQGHTLVTGGYGTYASGGTPSYSTSENDYVTAAATADGKLALAYIPTARTITVDMAKLTASVTAHWFDPTSGAYLAIAGSPFANTGSRSFTTPATRADGSSDWVLVLEVQ
jgi:hypothetical protein